VPRPPRIQIAGGIYHVDTVATHGDRIFRDDADRARWLRLFRTVAERCRWDCLMYCLLSTHYHLAIRIEKPNLARGMQYLNARHAETVNHRRERRGHVFGSRYHSELVETASHALELSRYIPLNPVRAGLCASPEEWPWSSYAATIGLAPEPSWLKSDWVLGLFATNLALARERYRTFVAEGRLANPRPASTGSDPAGPAGR
jgi:REP element-mobilizing transposase RayT